MAELKIGIVQSNKCCLSSFLKEDVNDGEGVGEGIFISK